ncbi:SigE family RNA polymerase sigma factor [Streptomyces sp. 549]|uniref:SigE family RNA polymerase sigma factor n=1 Tax=Streptomyces sp. 549 TaxID=3049076 RepID=UPI0024C3C0F9|nr:SigE family RNA polymerase sigma factor [Streptomyces sp. 549]MDK1472695.1 SigE family RNA polymerase sigma factor [Streptomyces sp. 549]
MTTLHKTHTSAVLHTRLHTPSVPVRSTEKSGAVSGRGCARGTGRQRPAFPAYIAGVPEGGAVAARGDRRGDSDTGPAAGERGDSISEVGLTASASEVGLTASASEVGLTASASEVGLTASASEVGLTASASEAEFTAYVRERRASLYATAYHLTGDRFEAEDLLQSALFSTYRAWDRISDKAAVGGYLRRTMTNLHISAWRRRKLNEYPTEELPESPSGDDQDAMRGTELRAVLWQALARLPEPQRTMLVLRYYEGRTDPEIAEILDISVGTVKSSIWRSLRRLRDDEVLAFGRDQKECFGELVA